MGHKGGAKAPTKKKGQARNRPKAQTRRRALKTWRKAAPAVIPVNARMARAAEGWDPVLPTDVSPDRLEGSL